MSHYMQFIDSAYPLSLDSEFSKSDRAKRITLVGGMNIVSLGLVTYAEPPSLHITSEYTNLIKFRPKFVWSTHQYQVFYRSPYCI